MTEGIFFKVNRKKVVEAIVYVASARPGIDVFHILKIFFYADRTHFRSYGRPILGDEYVAMKDGPVPSFAYDLIKRNHSKVDRETLDFANQKLKFETPEGYIRVWAKEGFDDSMFSRTDIRCLDESINVYANMPFNALWNIVHKEPEYLAVYQEGTSTPMPNESLLPSDIQDRDSVIEYLRDTAQVTTI